MGKRSIDQRYVTKDAPYLDGYAIGDGFLRLHRHGGQDGVGHYWMGEFVDRRGFVSVYRQAGLTRLDAISDGRMLLRTWNRFYGDRTIARLARAFLTDLARAKARGESPDGEMGL